MVSATEPEVWEIEVGIADEWRHDHTTCPHNECIWLARWDDPANGGEPEVWCKECLLTDLFPMSWLTIMDFQLEVKITGSEIVHIHDYP